MTISLSQPVNYYQCRTCKIFLVYFFWADQRNFQITVTRSWTDYMFLIRETTLAHYSTLCRCEVVQRRCDETRQKVRSGPTTPHPHSHCSFLPRGHHEDVPPVLHGTCNTYRSAYKYFPDNYYHVRYFCCFFPLNGIFSSRMKKPGHLNFCKTPPNNFWN